MNSADASQVRYEGAEKTLEVHFCKDMTGKTHHGLRTLPRNVWDEILDQARCQVLSKSSSDSLDAYVLSESSLFVYDQVMYLKTCGRTTLLKCLAPLFRAAEEYANLRPDWLRFSHKNFAFPCDQEYPHVSFKEETKFCLEACSSTVASAHVLGDLLSDHWNVLFVDLKHPNNHTGPLDSLGSLRVNYESDASSTLSTNSTGTGKNSENIVNIMMYELDPSFTRHFYVQADESCQDAAVRATKASGIDTVFAEKRNVVYDAYMFLPCGYSVNVLIGDDFYGTVHITPEDEFSYASFETNLPEMSYEVFLERVISIFRPRKFTVALFSDFEKHEDCLKFLENDSSFGRVTHGSARIHDVGFAEMATFTNAS